MELNWTTFVLELFNFLVLVWLLKHFLYQPVKAVVVKRRATIEEQLNEARVLQEEAEALSEQYENRLVDWEREREAARQELHREIETERSHRHAGLIEELEAERNKRMVLAERQLQEQQRQNERQALEQGARFVSRLLEAVASDAVQDMLFEHLLQELQHLPPAQLDALRSVTNSGREVTVVVVSAYPLSETQQQQLREQIGSRVPHPLSYEFHEDRKLIAGLHLTVGPWVIHANLHDELKTFAAIAYEH